MPGPCDPQQWYEFAGENAGTVADIASIKHDYPPISAAFDDQLAGQRDFELVEEMMTVATGVKPQQEANQRQPERREDLGIRYGAIGISAVAAAVRYAGAAKNQAYAPVVHQVERRFTEAAAS